MTNDLSRRKVEHRNGEVGRFSRKYRTTDLMWCEHFGYVHDAIAREKQLKNWHREWKWILIRESNPDLLDLTEEVLLF
jgi:putative endonuclease